MADGKTLANLTNDTTAANSDNLMVWNGVNAARKISKANFLAEQNATNHTLSEALLSLKVVASSTTLDQIDANSYKTIYLDPQVDAKFSKDLLNLTVFFYSESSIATLNSYYDGDMKKLVLVVGNNSSQPKSNVKIFYRYLTFLNKNLADAGL